MVVCDLDGTPLDGLARRRPATPPRTGSSTSTLPEVGGIVHTHSPYATAWAVRGEPIPCVMTAMADEFGGEIPVGPFALIGDEAIGRGVVETLTGAPLARGADARARRVRARRRARATRSRPP